MILETCFLYPTFICCLIEMPVVLRILFSFNVESMTRRMRYLAASETRQQLQQWH